MKALNLERDGGGNVLFSDTGKRKLADDDVVAG
jgi:hypothetical protein